jgi:hypothetical protein
MSIYKPYTYLIGWSNVNKFYYGVRFAKNCSPDDLWEKYFTSSKHVKHMRKKYGEPDVLQIRKTFETKEQAVLWEEKVLRRLNIKHNEKMLNCNIAGAIVKNLDHAKGKPSKLRGTKLSEEHKEKLRKPKSVPSKLKGKKLSEEHKEKLRKAKENYVPWNKNKTKNDTPSLCRKGVNKTLHIGTKRITDGKHTKSLKPGEELPNGWYFGMAPRKSKD